jgi:hypothetical membrane protein
MTQPKIAAKESSTAVGAPTIQRRSAGLLLFAGSALFLLLEFIAAAAWTDPPYSYTYHYISNLGVSGPVTGLGQFMLSPLAWVMNTGFLVFGVLTFAGTVMLRGLRGLRRVAVTFLGTAVGVGGVILAFFPGDGQADAEGRFDYHGVGALLAIVLGNVLAIVLGRAHHEIGLSPRVGRVLTLLGIFGIFSFVLFMAVAQANVLVGLVERCAVYPVLFSFIYLGASIWKGGSASTAADVHTDTP